jgi:hypothetical protein
MITLYFSEGPHDAGVGCAYLSVLVTSVSIGVLNLFIAAPVSPVRIYKQHRSSAIRIIQARASRNTDGRLVWILFCL